ncbi:hypothetical protein [Pontibacillus litoralis]|uniref:Uncharacterized protein n=1 Tax=Pontibacillus litoralis JSM 072002 TaxID=1385512 RepID=A0A0A5G336_9BACI|nr:hypothetical protein [Pontibacillus litoralis]KGX87501.1 hypothetical protein N784_14745 [Pontibacillus litoralis JSM 072002]
MNLEILSPTTTTGAMVIGFLFALIYATYIKKKEKASWLYFFLTLSAGSVSAAFGVALLHIIGIVQ